MKHRLETDPNKIAEEILNRLEKNIRQGEVTQSLIKALAIDLAKHNEVLNNIFVDTEINSKPPE